MDWIEFHYWIVSPLLCHKLLEPQCHWGSLRSEQECLGPDGWASPGEAGTGSRGGEVVWWEGPRMHWWPWVNLSKTAYDNLQGLLKKIGETLQWGKKKRHYDSITSVYYSLRVVKLKNTQVQREVEKSVITRKCFQWVLWKQNHSLWDPGSSYGLKWVHFKYIYLFYFFIWLYWVLVASLGM